MRMRTARTGSPHAEGRVGGMPLREEKTHAAGLAGEMSHAENAESAEGRKENNR